MAPTMSASAKAEAAPSPTLNGGWNEMRYVYHAATQVALPGPPWVMARISSKTMKAKVVLRMRLTAMTGKRRGKVTPQNRWAGEAPSTSAASYSSPGMPWSAAWYSRMLNGVVRHTYAVITAAMARPG